MTTRRRLITLTVAVLISWALLYLATYFNVPVVREAGGSHSGVAFASQTAPIGQTDQPIAELLKVHQYDLAADGKTLLQKEAAAAAFFLIGGLHGDKETPALVDALWPTIAYQYLAVEKSPWAARRLPFLRIAPDKLSVSDSGLLFWADSYDALVGYREVHPL